mgnify:CR=1 FL=1
MANKPEAHDVVVAPFPPDVRKVTKEVDVSDLTSDVVMSQVRLWCDRDTVVVFFRRGGKLYCTPSHKPVVPTRRAASTLSENLS